MRTPSPQALRNRYVAVAAAALTTVSLGVPATASAGSQYFVSSPGGFGKIEIGEEIRGSRHSLTRISARHHFGANPSVCVFGADGNNMYARNTDYYCAGASDLASTPALGAILRYPWVGNYGAKTYVRALSEW